MGFINPTLGVVLEDTGVVVFLGVVGLDDRSLGVVRNLGVVVLEAGVLRFDVLKGDPAEMKSKILLSALLSF